MIGRALRIGDVVEIRPSKFKRLLDLGLGRCMDVGARYSVTGEYKLVGRRCLHLRADSVFDGDLNLWPSFVRLADGTAARADRRFAAREKEIEAMKAERRKGKKVRT